jgi:hypothetical protein
MKKLKLKALGLGAKEILTREQLKYVLGGDGSGSGAGGGGGNTGGGSGCPTSPCSVFNSTNGKTYTGNCGLVIAAMDFHTVSTVCECVTSLGFYIPSSSNGHSACNP